MRNASTPINLIVIIALVLLGFLIKHGTQAYKLGVTVRQIVSADDFDIKMLITYPKHYAQTIRQERHNRETKQA